MVVKTTKDGVVQLYLNGELKLEQPEVSAVNIGTYIDYEDEEVSKCDYDTAFIGKDATFTGIEVFADGQVFVDKDGKIASINITGGTLTGAPLCVNASGWYGAGICLSSADYTQDGPGAVLLTGGTFSGCSVNPLNGYTGHGGAIETYGGMLSVQDAVFSGNSANGTGAAGGAMALMFSNNTVSGGTFTRNTAYFGGAIQQNGGGMTVSGALFDGNATAGDPTADYAPGGGAIEIHNGATASISGSTFSANVSRSGGAIYNDTYNTAASEASVDGCIFDANSVDYQGGAIYNYAVLTIADSVFSGNSVIETESNSYTSFGGAVANTKNGSLTVTGGTFSANSAVQGGAIATFIDYGSSDAASLTVSGASFDSNIATYGGGIYIQTGMADSTSISGSDFSGNAASYGGGAVCQCFGPLTVTGGTFSANSAGKDGGAIAVWDSGNTATEVSGALFGSNTAAYGGAISHSWASAALNISGCTFTSNGGEKTEQGGAVWNDENSTGVVTVRGCTFSGNTANAGGAVWNAGNMKLENIVLATASDTVCNYGSLAFAGENVLGAGVVNEGKITFSLASGTDALLSDLGAFSGSGSFLVKLSGDSAAAGAKLAESAGTFSGSLSVKLDDIASSDSFTIKGGGVGNDLAIAGDAVLRLSETGGALSVKRQALQKLVPAVSKDGSVMTWTDGEYTGEYRVEIAQDDAFDKAIRIATSGTAFDVAGRAGTYSCRASEADGVFTAGSASWTSSETVPRQVASNGNGRADVFFASVDGNDVWSGLYQAKNMTTGETAEIRGKNRIRDTFTGSDSDANILYLSDLDNGDAFFMDDIYSEFGDDARLSLIREVRAGEGNDVVDMTSAKYAAELAGMTVRGGAGDDVLWGAEGGNSLFGDAGNDRISGGAGDDVIAGGAGDDALNGGGGNDIFTFGENWGNDVVSQSEGEENSVTLWFESGSEANWNAETLTYTDGENSVAVSGATAIELKFGAGADDAVQFANLKEMGAFLGSTTQAVFETEENRSKGILASL
jgi:Ca2+-binding RTX toxin-like protein